MGWRELDYIPVRVFLKGGPASNQPVRVDFEHGTATKPGIQNLTGFTVSSNVVFTSAPVLSAPLTTTTWSYSLAVTLTDNAPAFVEFRARLLAGSHVNVGSSLRLDGTPSLGTLQIFKPSTEPGHPDLAVGKTGQSIARPDEIITYTLSYTNLPTTTNISVGAQLSDVLPPSVSYVPASASAGGSIVGNTLYWDLGNLSVGSHNSVTYQVQVHSGLAYGDTFSNLAVVLSSEDDANNSDNTASLTTTVRFNRPPIANNDSYSVDEFKTLLVPAPGVLANDTDADGNVLTVGPPRPVSGPSHGSLTLNADGSLSYTPTGNYTGSDSFTYVANDGLTNSVPATVTISVQPVTTPPLINCAGPLTVNCALDVPPPDLNTVLASDQCGGGSVTVSFVSDVISTSNCVNRFVITRTYRATDLCGNHADCTQTITVQDNAAPIIACPTPLTVSCPSAIPQANTSLVAAPVLGSD